MYCFFFNLLTWIYTAAKERLRKLFCDLNETWFFYDFLVYTYPVHPRRWLRRLTGPFDGIKEKTFCQFSLRSWAVQRAKGSSKSTKTDSSSIITSLGFPITTRSTRLRWMNSRTSCMQHNVGKKELHLVSSVLRKIVLPLQLVTCSTMQKISLLWCIDLYYVFTNP